MEAKILIVDDEKAILSFVAAILASDGYSIMVTSSGLEARELIYREDFDLVLSDLVMPEVNGLELLRELRHRSPHTALVIMTAYASIRSAIMAIRLGASDYLIKPFDEEELRLRVKNAVDKALLQRKYEARSHELESLVFAISHDLAGHLVALRGFSRRLRTKCKQEIPSEGIEYLNHMDASAERMEMLVKAVSDFAKAGVPTGRREIVDLNVVVSDVLQNFQGAIEEKNVNVEVALELPKIEAEWINAYQVFHNLIGNAIKFAREDVQPHIEIRAVELDQHYQISVSDNGVGIRKEDRDKIFEMFGRGSEGDRIPGTGMGLAIVKRIINKLGGEIWVESEEGKGATFYFTMLKPIRMEREHEQPISVRS